MKIKNYYGATMKAGEENRTLGLRDKNLATFFVDGVQRCLYNDVELFNYMLKHKYFSYSHRLSRNFSFAEIIQATEDVDFEVLDYLVKYARRHFKNLNPEEYISLVNNVKVLEWFFSRGYKCKHYPGHGKSTMEGLFLYSDISKDVVLNLIKKYNAEDNEYLNSEDCVESIKELF